MEAIGSRTKLTVSIAVESPPARMSVHSPLVIPFASVMPDPMIFADLAASTMPTLPSRRFFRSAAVATSPLTTDPP